MKVTAKIDGLPCYAWARQRQERIPPPGGGSIPGMTRWHGIARLASWEAADSLFNDKNPHTYAGPLTDPNGKVCMVEGTINITRVNGPEVEFQGTGVLRFFDGQST